MMNQGTKENSVKWKMEGNYNVKHKIFNKIYLKYTATRKAGNFII